MAFNVSSGMYVFECACDACDIVGQCLPVADGVYCADCYQAAQDAITDEMDEAFTDDELMEDPRDYYQEMIDAEPVDYDYDFGFDSDLHHEW